MFFGYALIDNFPYLLNIRFKRDGISVNEEKGKVTHRNGIFSIFLSEFILEGTVHDNFFSGKAYGIYPENKKSKGVFTTFKVDKTFYNLLNRYGNFWQFLALNTDKIVPKIYPNIFSHKSLSLTVMSFNVCSDFIWTGEKGMKEVSQIIRYYNPQICLLQEIGENNFQKLSKMLHGMYSDYRVGIFTNYPIIKVFPREPFSPIFGAKIKVGERIFIRVFNSHLTDEGYGDVEESEKVQLPNIEYGLYSSVYNIESEPDLASILVGDHNSPSHLDTDKSFPVSKKLERDGWIDTYRKANSKVDLNKDYTWPNCDTIPKIMQYETGKYCKLFDKDKERIDYIYVKNGKNVSFKTKNSKVVSEWKGLFPSDHNALITTLELIYN